MKQPIPFLVPWLSFSATVASAFVFYACPLRYPICKNGIRFFFWHLMEKALRNEIVVPNAETYS